MEANGASTEYGEAVRAVRAGELDADEAADQLIARLTERELLGLLDGDAPWWVLPLIPLFLHRRPFVAGAVPASASPASASATVRAAS